MNNSKLAKHTAVMTAVNLIMRSASVFFNAYLTSKVGSAGMGLFQLVMTVYSLAVTFSCAGIKLAATRKRLRRTPAAKRFRIVHRRGKFTSRSAGHIIFLLYRKEFPIK